jgi:hypothetical protein
MSVYIEALKQMNLVDFLTEHYGLNFIPSGSGLGCLNRLQFFDPFLDCSVTF